MSALSTLGLRPPVQARLAPRRRHALATLRAASAAAVAAMGGRRAADGAARRAAARERADIARELHDIVAHHMAVVSLHARLAEQAVDRDPATARTAITTAGNASREALTEMRRLVARLRSGDPGTPGLASLDELAQRVRNAGVPVEIAVTGRPRALPPGPELSAYRVAQESLTNVVRHAGHATARIRLDYGDDALSLTISDTGTGPGEVPDAVAYGLRGMRERAAHHGGSLRAGPGAGGGFEVALTLPIGEPA